MYFIYEHYDKDGNRFYVGKGSLYTDPKTGKQTYHRAFTKCGRNNEWKKKAEGGYSYKIIATYDDEILAKMEEIRVINECEECVNKVKTYIVLGYKITKIIDKVAILSVNNVIGGRFILTAEGKVFNTQGRELKPMTNIGGYRYICFRFKTKQGKERQKNLYLHRIIAESFIDNPENKSQVNHKNFNKSDNSVDNLEWVTPTENINHYLQQGASRSLKLKPVLKIDEDGNVVDRYTSAKQAAELHDCTESLISQAANKENKTLLTTKGFRWQYEENSLTFKC